jgi:hypothetical protein
MIKMKRKFVNVSPLSLKAKDRFENIMDKLHACKIEEETPDKFFLSSINNQYYFWIQKVGNDHWKVER